VSLCVYVLDNLLLVFAVTLCPQCCQFIEKYSQQGTIIQLCGDWCTYHWWLVPAMGYLDCGFYAFM